MDIAIQVFERVAAMSNHRARKRGHGFGGNFDRARCEKFVVLLHEGIIRRFRRFAQTFLFLDEADIAAAFKPGGFDFFDIFGGRAQAQVFFEVVLGNEMLLHCLPIDLSISDQFCRLTFDQLAETVRAISNERKETMDHH